MMIHTKASGMSIMEFLIYMVLVGALLAVLGPRIKQAFVKVKTFKTEAVLQDIQRGVQEYQLKNDRFPTTNEGLELLAEQGFIQFKNDELPRDAWGNEFEYNAPPKESPKFKRYEIISPGADADSPASMIIVGE